MATPVAGGLEEYPEYPKMLFVQSYQSGSIAPKDGAEGQYTITLEHGLGQTLFFTDRPDRKVGTSPTPDFLKGLGFAPDNPPNAALLVETSDGVTDIAVVELFSPTFDEASRTTTYEAMALADWQDSLELGLARDPADLATFAPTFGAAHLFIDDCPDAQVACCSQWNFYTLECENAYVGYFPSMSYCYSWWNAHCQPCEPYGHSIPACKDVDDCPEVQYWANKCDDNFGSCNGICQPIFYP